MLFLAPQLLSFAPSTGGVVAASRRLALHRSPAPLATYDQDEAICATDEVICATVGELDAAAAPAAAKVDLDGLFGGVEEGKEAAVDDVIANSDVDPRMVELLAAKGIVKFTPIQIQSYALLRRGADMLGRSQTGTGKTLAFALPMMQRVQDSRAGPKERGRKTAILVLAPTRELARQVAETFEMLARPDGLSVSVFHGGTPYGPQQRALRDGLDVIVGTPGRIIDHLQNGDLDLSEVQHVVLDEADEMLNMGFKDDVETMLAACTHEARQTVLFSATHPPWYVAIGSRACASTACASTACATGLDRCVAIRRHSLL